MLPYLHFFFKFDLTNLFQVGQQHIDKHHLTAHRKCHPPFWAVAVEAAAAAAARLFDAAVGAMKWAPAALGLLAAGGALRRLLGGGEVAGALAGLPCSLPVLGPLVCAVPDLT
jgi:hypothetical protein